MARATGLSNRAAANRKAGKSPAPAAPRPRGGGVKLPYTPPEFVGPPPGTYDPGLEAQVRASERGLLDLIEQERLGGKRGRQDTRQAQNLLRRKIEQGRSDIERQRGYDITDAGQADARLKSSFAQDLEDLGIAKQRGEEDYQKALVDMQHRYATAAQRQGEASIKQGTHEAGTTTASDAVRGANSAYDKTGVDVVHQRNVDDLARREARLREDFGINEGELQEGLGRQLEGYGIQGRRLTSEGHTQFNALHLAALRAQQDRTTKISHAKREQAIYSTDVAGQAYYQAHQLNPHILFPTPAAAAGPPGAPHPPAPRRPSIGIGAPARYPTGGVGVHSAVKRPRRPYTRH